jgi:glycosyltransferase involved in cell wall biosynthesis
MRIAVATWSIRAVGGVEEYLSILLPALIDAGIDVALWHELDRPSERARIDVPPQVTVFSAPESGLAESVNRLRAWRPDVLYVQGLTEADTEAALLAIAPAVFFVHSYAGTCISGNKTTTRPVAIPCDRHFGRRCLGLYFPRGCGGNNPLTMWRLFSRQTRQLEQLRRYSAVLTHSDHMRRELRRHDVAAEVIPFAVRTTYSAPKATRGAWRLLFAGRMEFLKGGELLLDAMPAIVTSLNRPLRLTIAGDGPERHKWESRARELQAKTSALEVVFPGWLSQARLAGEFADTDLLVVPSIWPEPFGSIGPMAAQHGVPAAAFAVGGIPQWLHDDVSGHLAPASPPTSHCLASAVVRCLHDPGHYAELKTGAREAASGFTMAAHLPSLLETFGRAAVDR